LKAVAVQIAARQKASQAADSQGLIESCKVLYRTLVIDANWHMADPADHEVFSQFQVEYIRYLTEGEQKGADGVPLNVVFDIGGHEIAFMRPAMMSRVSYTFERKQQNLEGERKRWL